MVARKKDGEILFSKFALFCFKMHQGQKKRFVSLEFITHFSSRDSKQKKINFPKTLKQMSSSFSILYSGNLVLTTSLKT